ncbi:hypothetical protein [Paraclostridium sordellii]|uniref:hypothetical protein n=1 Tax=Paraclostridium sordellii TaxID=1505 RepID=UPI003A7F1049
MFLLDILINKINGMYTARKIIEIENKAEIIFITSLIEYFIEVYEGRTYRYLVKPVKYNYLKIHILNCIKELDLKINTFKVILFSL